MRRWCRDKQLEVVMTVKYETVELKTEELILAFDRLCMAVCAQGRYPLDVGLRMQTDNRRSELHEAFIKFLMLVDIIE